MSSLGIYFLISFIYYINCIPSGLLNSDLNVQGATQLKPIRALSLCTTLIKIFFKISAEIPGKVIVFLEKDF